MKVSAIIRNNHCQWIINSTLVLALALALSGCAGSGSSATQGSMSKTDAEAKVNNMATVILVKKAVPAGEKITEEDIETKEIEKAKVPPGSMSSKNEALGKITKFGVSPGMMLSRRDVL